MTQGVGDELGFHRHPSSIGWVIVVVHVDGGVGVGMSRSEAQDESC